MGLMPCFGDMESDTNQSASQEIDLTNFLRVRDENFHRLMQSRTSIRERYQHDIHLLEMERDAKLMENFALLQKLGIPEDEMPLPPENEEIKKSRLADGAPRKLSDTEIKRFLKERMELGKTYTANQLVGLLEISYKDFSEFYQKFSHDNEFKNPPFLFGKGKFKWRTYRLWEPTDPKP